MKVYELMDILKDHDPEMRVVVRGYEAGYDDVDRVVKLNVCLNVHKEWYHGKHDILDSADEAEEYQQEEVLYLRGDGNE